MNNIITILILKILIIILFVIIFGIIVLLFQKNGKIINIKIQKKHKEKDQIEPWLCNKLTMRKRFQIKNIIMIQDQEINIIILQHIILNLKDFQYPMHGMINLCKIFLKIQILQNKLYMDKYLLSQIIFLLIIKIVMDLLLL